MLEDYWKCRPLPHVGLSEHRITSQFLSSAERRRVRAQPSMATTYRTMCGGLDCDPAVVEDWRYSVIIVGSLERSCENVGWAVHTAEDRGLIKSLKLWVYKCNTCRSISIADDTGVHKAPDSSALSNIQKAPVSILLLTHFVGWEELGLSQRALFVVEAVD